MTQVLGSKRCPFQILHVSVHFCNQSHPLWPWCWLLTQPQHLSWTWYNSDCLISLIMGRELYQHMCFTSTLQGSFHAVIFHCIITFLGMQLQLLNMWSILHCSINTILLYLCLDTHALVHVSSVYLCVKLFVYHSDFSKITKNEALANAQYRHSVTINACSLRFE